MQHEIYYNRNYNKSHEPHFVKYPSSSCDAFHSVLGSHIFLMTRASALFCTVIFLFFCWFWISAVTHGLIIMGRAISAAVRRNGSAFWASNRELHVYSWPLPVSGFSLFHCDRCEVSGLKTGVVGAFVYFHPCFYCNALKVHVPTRL